MSDQTTSEGVVGVGMFVAAPSRVRVGKASPGVASGGGRNHPHVRPAVECGGQSFRTAVGFAAGPACADGELAAASRSGRVVGLRSRATSGGRGAFGA